MPSVFGFPGLFDEAVDFKRFNRLYIVDFAALDLRLKRKFKNYWTQLARFSHILMYFTELFQTFLF